MIRGRRRGLTAGERRLWAEVARDVAPLRGRPAPEIDASGRAPPDVVVETPPPVPPAPAAIRRAAPPHRPVLPPLASLERKTARALARGRRGVDASIDLHGLDQAAAHAGLVRFLRGAQAEGHALVLVVTGQGGVGRGSRGEERGVLRRLAPLWLAAPELRGIVLGLDQAGPRQGGAGALYVRLRRARPRP